jgi:ATPase family associated with various cellular activities (AAA)
MQTNPSTTDTPTPTAQALVWLSRRYPHRRLTLVIALLCLVIGSLGGSATWLLSMVGAGLLAYCGVWLVRSLRLIDANIRATVGVARGWKVHAKIFPAYKYVDLYHAAQRWSGERQHSVEICSQHLVPLAAILRGSMAIGTRAINAAPSEPRKIGYEQVTYLPVDTFWLIPPQPGRPHTAAIIRIWHYQRGGPIQLEVATPRPHDAEQILEEIGEIALAHSIYRNRMIRVAFGPEVSTDYGDDESLEEMDLLFYDEKRIDEQDIILDDAHRGIIDRTIIDFHQRRERLRQLGLSGKRGVLFYGPPGTGKTYTCKYIAQQLDGATTIVVTGAALLRMKAVCAIAKVFQPAFVLLEDVDLVFSHREGNAYNTVLGEFIDQLDGFGEADQILFILTTNAIERIEPAIKDRPGRVSQCIYFGPPSAPLRRRYLDLLVQPYDAASVNLQQIVGQTDGVSQAFLKELVARTIQIASRASSDAEPHIRLTDADFQSALHDMTQGVGYVGQRIIGFRMDGDH